MPDTSGILKLLSLFAICGVIVFSFWLTLEKGSTIAKMGKAEPVEETHVRLPVPVSQSPPAAYQARATNLPPEASRPDAQPSSGTTYKWVDEKGTVHFSDRPMSADSKQIEVQPINSYNYPQTRPAYVAQVRQVQQTEPEKMHAQPVSRPPISAADYKWFNSAFQAGDDVILSGRVEGGPECKALHLHIYAQSNRGRTITATTVVEDAGRGGKLFKVVRRVPYPKTAAWPTWEITDVQARCSE